MSADAGHSSTGGGGGADDGGQSAQRLVFFWGEDGGRQRVSTDVSIQACPVDGAGSHRAATADASAPFHTVYTYPAVVNEAGLGWAVLFGSGRADGGLAPVNHWVSRGGIGLQSQRPGIVPCCRWGCLSGRYMKCGVGVDVLMDGDVETDPVGPSGRRGDGQRWTDKCAQQCLFPSLLSC